MKELIELLKQKQQTISTMESCTGGGVVNEITNVEGASDVLKFSAVTYSNEFKIKMGVNKETIDKFSVYSLETAKEMAKNISKFTNSTYGVGITGKINKIDKNNLQGLDNIVFISIYDSSIETYYNFKFKCISSCTREQNKKLIIQEIIKKMKEIIK